MDLCFISSNIRFDNPNDGVNSWPHRRLLLAETLLKHRPHVIATQEGRFDQLKDLQTLLKDYDIVDFHRSWIKERMYPSLFVKKNTFEILKSEDHWLSETPTVAGSKSFESAFPRLMTWVQVQVKNSPKNILFIDTHLDHIKPETRFEQIKVLSQEIKRIWDKTSSLVIMGDFNDSPDGEVRKFLENEFPTLKDSWKQFNSTEETSHHSFDGKCLNGSRIDWILTDMKITNSFMDKNQSEGRYPSDHFPIICQVKI